MRPTFAAAFILFSVFSFAGRLRAVELEVPLRLTLVGDSTVSEYLESGPTRGWGQYLQPFFRKRVKVLNRAKAGSSTRTFVVDGLWEQALKEKPAIVLIQFGHNDKVQRIEAATDYSTNLRYYIDDARRAGATPIFVTPMYLRNFKEDGRLVDALGSYAEAMRRVAAEKNVAVIDLHTSSGLLFAKLGPGGSSELAAKPGDTIHFNQLGARAMAQLVIRELTQVERRLQREVVQVAPGN